MLVVEEIPRHHYQCLVEMRKGFDLMEEVLEGRMVLLFPGTFRVAYADMNIRNVKDMVERHLITDYKYIVDQF